MRTLLSLPHNQFITEKCSLIMVKAKYDANITFVSQAAYDKGIKEIIRLERQVLPQKIAETSLKRHAIQRHYRSH